MSFGQYINAGWFVCAIQPGQRSPTSKGWNREGSAIGDAEHADVLSSAGLLHRWSGTCAIDIDDLARARVWLHSKGIDIDELWNAVDAVRIIRGDPNRGKLIYALPEPLATKRITHPTGLINPKTNKPEIKTILEFRCADRNNGSHQDVLPPSLHPSGTPYSWDYAEAAIGDWRALPLLPEVVRALWVEQGGDLTEVPAKLVKSSSSLPSIEDIKDAVEFLDADIPRNEWLAILQDMVVLTQGSTEGYQLFDAWSATATNGSYKGKRDTLTQWNSIDYRKARYVGYLAVPSGEDAFDDLPIVVPDQAQSMQMQASTQRIALVGQNRITRQEFAGRMVFLSAADRYYDLQQGILVQSDHALRQIYRPYMPRVSGIPEDPLKVLELNQAKKVVYATAFHPGAGSFFIEGDREYINEYKPSIVPELDPTKEEADTLAWLFNRIDDKKYREWLLKWFAHSIQCPGDKIMSAPLIWSEQEGTGKSTLLQKIPELLYGAQYCHNVSHDSLSSSFNDYLIGKWYIHLSELYTNARNERSNISRKLKWMITDSLEIHPKGRPAFTVPNRVLSSASSNEAGAAQMSTNDRRWGVHELCVPEFTDSEREAVYTKFLSTPRAAGVIRKFFLNISTTGFDPKAHAIKTDAREAMIDMGESDWITIIREGRDEAREAPFTQLCFHLDEMREYLKLKGVYAPSPNSIGHKLRGLGFTKMVLDLDLPEGRKVLRLWCLNKNANLPHKQYYDSWKSGANDFDVLT